jgi:hypothetical protein
MPYLNLSLTAQGGSSLNVGMEVSEQAATELQGSITTLINAQLAAQLAAKPTVPPAASEETPMPEPTPEASVPIEGGTDGQ